MNLWTRQRPQATKAQKIGQKTMYCQRHVKYQTIKYVYAIKDSKGEVGDNLLEKFIEK